jgi:hypothetical protein
MPVTFTALPDVTLLFMASTVPSSESAVGCNSALHKTPCVDTSPPITRSKTPAGKFISYVHYLLRTAGCAQAVLKSGGPLYAAASAAGVRGGVAALLSHRNRAWYPHAPVCYNKYATVCISVAAAWQWKTPLLPALAPPPSTCAAHLYWRQPMGSSLLQPTKPGASKLLRYAAGSSSAILGSPSAAAEAPALH